MAEKYGFFNSVNGDRIYNAEDIGGYFTKLVSDGVFGSPTTNLQVMATTGLTVSILAGWGFIACHWLNNTSSRVITLNSANPSLSRIDRIILRLDRANRRMELAVLNGTPAGTPTAPALTRTSNGVYELSLAQVRISAGATALAQADITDERGDTSVCGYATSLLGIGGIRIIKLTEEEYESLSEKQPDVLYIATTDIDFTLYLGELPLRQSGGVGTPTYGVLNTSSPPPAVIGHATIEEE